jgi:hypothetical protein
MTHFRPLAFFADWFKKGKMDSSENSFQIPQPPFAKGGERGLAIFMVRG